jgi:hypothetical protein
MHVASEVLFELRNVNTRSRASATCDKGDEPDRDERSSSDHHSSVSLGESVL